LLAVEMLRNIARIDDAALPAVADRPLAAIHDRHRIPTAGDIAERNL